MGKRKPEGQKMRLGFKVTSCQRSELDPSPGPISWGPCCHPHLLLLTCGRGGGQSLGLHKGARRWRPHAAPLDCWAQGSGQVPAAGPCCPAAARSAHPALRWGLGAAASPRAPRRRAAGGTPREHMGTAAPLVQAACFPHPHSPLPSPISQKGSLMAVTWRGLSAPCSCQPCLPEPRSCLCVTVSSDAPTGTGWLGGQHPHSKWGSPPPPAVCPAPLPLTLKVPTPLPRTP